MRTNRDAQEFLEDRFGPFTFGDFLSGARFSKDMTQVQMAKFLGISKSTLCDIEKGRQLVSPTLASKIATRCQLSVAVAVEASLQDQLRKAKLKYKVKLVA